MYKSYRYKLEVNFIYYIENFFLKPKGKYLFMDKLKAGENTM